MSIWTNCVGTIGLHKDDSVNIKKVFDLFIDDEFDCTFYIRKDDTFVSNNCVRFDVSFNIREGGARGVHVFDNLVRYLRDEADWPNVFRANFEINTRIII